jgi:hypothetical protein
MTGVAVVMLVGPTEQEVRGAADTLDSLWAYEPGVGWCVLIDDSVEDRGLTRRLGCPRSVEVVSIVNPRRGRGTGILGGACTGMLSALSWIHAQAEPRFCLKLDTDALVIAPFGEKIARAFQASPGVGMVGSYDMCCDGTRRSFVQWSRRVAKLAAPVALWRKPRRRWRHVQVNLWGRRAIVRRHIQAALAQGYERGTHCLGGAYAIEAEMLRRMAQRGYLDDPLLWLHSECAEDVMLGIYTRAVGLQSMNLVGRDEPFGIQHRGLVDSPANLVARGYSLIHSVKNDPAFTEEAIRAFFAAKRQGAA